MTHPPQAFKVYLEAPWKLRWRRGGAKGEGRGSVEKKKEGEQLSTYNKDLLFTGGGEARWDAPSPRPTLLLLALLFPLPEEDTRALAFASASSFCICMWTTNVCGQQNMFGSLI